MHHNHRAFDQADPDVAKAIEDACPIVAELLNERLKPQPRDVDQLRAWRGVIADLEEQLGLIAGRVGWSGNELERTAAAELRHQRRSAAAPAPAPAPQPAKRITPAESFAALAAELADLERKLADIEERHCALDRERRPIAKRAEHVRKRLYPFGRRRAVS